MLKKEKVAFILRTLERLFPDPPIPLRHKDPFTLLVAVVLSGRSTDAMVNRVTPALFALADTPQKMAKLPVETVRAVIRPCGLSPAKARALVGLSKLLVSQHGGQVPRTFAELEALPGVGHKTASVVLAQAFHIATLPVDTHIHRLAHRWGLTHGTTVARTEKDLKRAFPQDRWIRLHLQMIYYGRAYCPARGHSLERCEVCRRVNEKKGKKLLF